jgi:hypothetical protein
MVNLRALGCLPSVAHVVVLGCNVQTGIPNLEALVPKREVFYVGGQYTNISVTFRRHWLWMLLIA